MAGRRSLASFPGPQSQQGGVALPLPGSAPLLLTTLAACCPLLYKDPLVTLDPLGHQGTGALLVTSSS